MIFSHVPILGANGQTLVPITHIRELFCGPTAEFWTLCVRYAYNESRSHQGLREAVRVLSMTIYAHARHHFNIPHSDIAELNARALTSIINRLHELMSLNPVLFFSEIERTLAEFEPYIPCLEPVSDGVTDKACHDRFDPDA